MGKAERNSFQQERCNQQDLDAWLSEICNLMTFMAQGHNLSRGLATIQNTKKFEVHPQTNA